MSEKRVIIIESEGNYNIQNDGLSEFELIGILECLVFELKSARQRTSSDKKIDAAAAQEINESPKETPQETSTSKDTVQPAASPELRTRINNAVKAIKSLGGQVDGVNRSDATDAELQTELEELTDQYKRLKSSKGK